MNYRALFSDNGTLSDFSVALNEYSTKTKLFDYTTAQDALYLGARVPFNHLYFKLSSLNLVASTMTVQYWNGSSWESAVELFDETQGFTQSGFMQFTPNKNVSWMIADSANVTGITSATIYDRYWIKITFSATMTGTTALDWIGNLFSDDQDLAAEYPDLARSTVMTSFAAGKTSWQEQSVKAAAVLVQDLINKGVLKNGSQILDWREFTLASVQKTAEIIFHAFGDDYVDQEISARKEYNERLSKAFYRIDRNENAKEDPEEETFEGFLSR
jgi:hypothetical protein